MKERIDSNISFVDELADMLELSTDSAYRRMRGETSLTFEELALLSKRFNISVDSLMESETNELTFQFQPLKEDGFNFIEYLKYIEQNMKLIEAEAKATIMKSAATSEAEWEKIMAQGSQSSWKDEWLTILFSVPLVLCFTGEWGRQTVSDGFAALESMPEWYQYTLGVIVAASFGVRSATKFFGGKK